MKGLTWCQALLLSAAVTLVGQVDGACVTSGAGCQTSLVSLSDKLEKAGQGWLGRGLRGPRKPVVMGFFVVLIFQLLILLS